MHMGSLKEGRKALILVSEGYTNMLPPQMRDADAQHARARQPERAAIRWPAPTTQRRPRGAGRRHGHADSDLREVYDTANRNNVAIYAVDPRGLADFEFDINEGIGLQIDRKYLNSTMDTLRTLAENTDGRAIVNRNDLVVGMKQIVRDASAYYLIGYNSTQAPTDGKFHEIKVRVKRPGVQVRARKGYWALTAGADGARARRRRRPRPPKAGRSGARRRSVGPAVARASSARWIGTSRGENGKTRVTFVWEPLPRTPGDRGAREPARVALMAVAPTASPYSAAASPIGVRPIACRRPGRCRWRAVTFDVNPGKIQLRMSVEGAGLAGARQRNARNRDARSDVGADRCSGRRKSLRARTAREFQQLKADPAGVPIAGARVQPHRSPAHSRARLRARRHDADAQRRIC